MGGWLGGWVGPSMGGGVTTDVESSSRIEISQLGQDLFDF